MWKTFKTVLGIVAGVIFLIAAQTYNRNSPILDPFPMILLLLISAVLCIDVTREG